MSRLIALARRILPPHRQAWGDAMQAEHAAIADPREGLAFALGCLWAAVAERVTLAKLFAVLGRLGVGLVALAYGGLFLWGFASLLIFFPIHHHANFHRNAPPIMIWTLAMGLSHACAGAFLIRWRPKPFSTACAAAGLTALALPLRAALVHHLSGPPLVYAWPFVPLIMLALAALFLDWLGKAPTKRIAS